MLAPVISSLDEIYCICMLTYSFIYPIQNQKNKTELNELSELEYLKTPSQKSSNAH